MIQTHSNNTGSIIILALFLILIIGIFSKLLLESIYPLYQQLQTASAREKALKQAEASLITKIHTRAHVNKTRKLSIVTGSGKASLAIQKQQAILATAKTPSLFMWSALKQKAHICSTYKLSQKRSTLASAIDCVFVKKAFDSSHLVEGNINTSVLTLKTNSENMTIAASGEIDIKTLNIATSPGKQIQLIAGGNVNIDSLSTAMDSENTHPAGWIVIHSISGHVNIRHVKNLLKCQRLISAQKQTEIFRPVVDFDTLQTGQNSLECSNFFRAHDFWTNILVLLVSSAS